MTPNAGRPVRVGFGPIGGASDIYFLPADSIRWIPLKMPCTPTVVGMAGDSHVSA